MKRWVFAVVAACALGRVRKPVVILLARQALSRGRSARCGRMAVPPGMMRGVAAADGWPTQQRREPAMRRISGSVGVLALALVGLVVAGRPGLGAVAQDASPPAGAAPDVVLDWIDAWVAVDPAAIAALYAADGVYEDVPNNHSIAAADIETTLAEYVGALGDIVVELDSAHGGDGWAVAEWTLSATNQGLFPDAPVGAPFSVRNATVFAIEGGEIVRSADYYDNATILTQLGLMPGAGAATPAATPTP